MAPTIADYLLERLRSWDVQHVFAYACARGHPTRC